MKTDIEDYFTKGKNYLDNVPNINGLLMMIEKYDILLHMDGAVISRKENQNFYVTS